MTRRPHVRLFVTLAALASAAIAADSATAPPAHLGAAESSAESRRISAAVADLLRAAAPKYVPPAATLPSPPSSLVEAEANEREMPRNGIIRLPRYVVEEPKLHIPQREREVLTKKGRLELALKRHPGLRIGNFGPLRNDRWAQALLDEDFARERAAEFANLLTLLPGSRRAPLQFRVTPPVIPAWSGPWSGLYVPWERR